MRLSIAFATIVVSLGQAVSAFAEGWIVSKVRQPANYTTDSKTWHRVLDGMEIPTGAWISTGPRGRVLLSHEEDMVTV